MKRALIVLLLLAVVAGGLFAQVTWSGWARSGLQITVPDEGDVTFRVYNAEPGNRTRFYLGASYTNEARTAGAWGAMFYTFSADGTWTNNGTVSMDGLNAWARPVETVLLRVGSGPGGFGSLGGFDSNMNVGDANALHAVFGPFTGLSIGATVQPNNAKFDDAVYSFGVRYNAAGVFAGVVNLRYNGEGNNNDGRVDVSAGFDFLGLSSAGLTKLAVDVVAENLTDNLLWVGVGPRVSFRVDNVTDAGNLTGQLRTKIWLPMGDDGGDLNFLVYAQAGVPLTGTVSANLDVGYEAKAALKGLIGVNAIDHRANPDGLRHNTSVTAKGLETSILLVTPSVTFNRVGGVGGASIQTGWSFQTELGGEGKTQNALYALFQVNF